MIEVTHIESMGSDLSVVNAARVSFGKKSEWNPDWRDDHYEPLLPADSKLIKYLAKHKHISPFGHAFSSFHVKAPIFVARQLVKHKFLRWNEISRRYVSDSPEFYTPALRWAAKDKKQGSADLIDDSTQVDDALRTAHVQARSNYNMLLRSGVCEEQARVILPQSLMTEWYWSGSLDAFADMCRLRCKEDTQYESRLVADQISEEMAELFPVSWAALMGETE